MLLLMVVVMVTTTMMKIEEVVMIFLTPRPGRTGQGPPRCTRRMRPSIFDSRLRADVAYAATTLNYSVSPLSTRHRRVSSLQPAASLLPSFHLLPSSFRRRLGHFGSFL